MVATKSTETTLSRSFSTGKLCLQKLLSQFLFDIMKISLGHPFQSFHAVIGEYHKRTLTLTQKTLMLPS